MDKDMKIKNMVVPNKVANKEIVADIYCFINYFFIDFFLFQLQIKK